MKFLEKIRYQYNLKKDDIVFDCGAYLGDFTDGIYNKYHCNILVFEPLLVYFRKLQERFLNIEKINLFHFGLLDGNFKTKMADQKDSSSLFTDGNNGEDVIIKDILEFIEENNIKKIDLIKINIEGGEYDLLNHMLDNGDITIFKNIQIQYHFRKKDKRQNLYFNAEDLIKNITKKLENTHVLEWRFPVWESWKRK